MSFPHNSNFNNSETSWLKNKAVPPTNSPPLEANPATPHATTQAKATQSTPTTINIPAPMSMASVKETASTSTQTATATRAPLWSIRSTESAGSPARTRASITVFLSPSRPVGKRN